MTNFTVSTKDVGNHFSDNWYDEKVDVFSDDIYQDLMAKLDDRNFIPQAKPLLSTHRALIACEQVIANLPKGSRVLDMACGIGFVTHCLISKGYDAEGFDISEKAIERAKAKSISLNQDPEKFYLADQRVLETLEDNSFDAILAMGYFRYLSREEQDYCYKQVARILKPGGVFVLVHQNILFEMFAINDGTLKFWAETIKEFSAVEELLEGKSVLDALTQSANLQKRRYDQSLTSKTLLDSVPENPLTYADTVKTHGFQLDRISYPNAHLLPPLLEATLDQEKLTALKHEVCLQRADNWRSMFMDYEFVAFLTLEKTNM